MNPASHLILVGPMGAGKSCIGRRLADRWGLRLFDMDHEIERDCGASVSTIFEGEGEAGFRARERAMLAALFDRSAPEERGVVIATGGGVVLDAGNRALLRQRGFVVYLKVDFEQQLRRLAHDRTRPLLARPDREQALHDLAAVRAPLYAQVADLEFDTSQLDVDVAATRLMQLLSSHWQRPEAPREP